MFRDLSIEKSINCPPALVVNTGGVGNVSWHMCVQRAEIQKKKKRGVFCPRVKSQVKSYIPGIALCTAVLVVRVDTNRKPCEPKIKGGFIWIRERHARARARAHD